MWNSHQRNQIVVVLVVIGLPVITCAARQAHICEVKHNADASHSTNRLESDYWRGQPTSMRITAVYTDNFKRLSNYWHIAQTYVEPALAVWRSALKVKRPLKKALRFRQKCYGGLSQGFTDDKGRLEYYCTHGCASSQICYNLAVPRQYLDDCMAVQNHQPRNTSSGGAGASNTDYLVFVDYKPDGCGWYTMAYAVHCQMDKGTDRPEIGMINYCPSKITFTEKDKKTIQSTTIHELAHAFGFSWYVVPYMRDENNNPRTRRHPTWNHPDEGTDSNNQYKPSPNSGMEVTRWWLTAEKYVQRTTKILKTPNVLKAARDHFKCPTLEGVELENNGGSGTAGSHFDKRIFYDEVMVGSVTGEGVLSNLTLGYFKDTGWYDVDYSRATAIKWGKGLGCDFATQSCYQYLQNKRRQNQPGTPWCDKVDHYCGLDKKYCTLGKMSGPMPETYRYALPSKTISRYEAMYYAGPDELMDFCPYEQSCGVRRS